VQTVFPRVSEAQCKDSRLIFSSQLVFDPLLSHFFCKRSATVRRVPYGHRRLDSSVVCCSGAWLNGPVAPQHGMKKHGRWLSIACGIATLLGSTTNATELKSETAAAFDRYIQATETSTEHDLGAGRFLVVDSLPETTREQVYAELKRGQFYTVPLRSEENGKPIPVPGGLIHHWVGVAFIPAATLSQTLAVLQDYENHKTIYKPDVRDSKLMARDGNDFQVFLQFYRKSLVTVVVNVNLDIQYTLLGATRAASKSYSTRIAEVADPGKLDEHELPVGNDHGYVWRLYSYWGVEEKDGGVYIQVQSIGLSRTIPWTIAWLVNPLVRSIPRSVLSRLLDSTRRAVEGRAKHRTVFQRNPCEPFFEGSGDLPTSMACAPVRRTASHSAARAHPPITSVGQ
jgi:hypothetical protein